MTIAYLSLAAIVLAAAALGIYARLRPKPAPAPAPAAMSIAELFEHRRRLWDSRTPLGELEAPTLAPWPEDEAAEMLAAWRDHRREWLATVAPERQWLAQ